MRFLADMGISPDTVQYLRGSGYTCDHVYELGLGRSSDSSILEKARVEEQIILTNDLDFSELIALAGYALPSVITFRLKDMRPANVNRYLNIILERHSEDLEKGVILSVTEKRIRVRRLPV